MCKMAYLEKHTSCNTIDFTGKACIMYVDFETILGTAVLENIIYKKRKET